MLALALANIRTYARRFIAVVLAVLIGTAFLAAAQMVNASTNASLQKSIGESYQDADAVASIDWQQYSGEGTGTLTQADVRAAAAVDGVSAVRGSSVLPARIAAENKTVLAGVQTLVQDPWSAPAITEGELPSSNRQVLVDEASAEDAGIAVGDTVGFIPGEAAEPVQVTVAGLAASSMNPITASTMQVYALPHLLTACYPADALDLVDKIHLKLDGPASAAVVLPDVADALAGSEAGPVSVLTAEEQTMAEVDSMAGGEQAITMILLVFVLIALVVTALVVVNTFSVLLAQRSRELALLRTVGASRRQLNRSVLTEASLVGLVASLLGVGLATGLMAVLAAVARTVMDAPFITLAVPPAAILVTTVVGTLLTMLSAWWPARRATRVAPLEAMRPTDAATETARLGRLRLILGGLLTLGGAALLALGAIEGQLLIGFAGGALSFIGLLLLAPLFVMPAVRGLGRLTARGVPSRLAGLNASRNPARTSATATALLIGVTLVTMMMTGAQTAKATFDSRLGSEYPVDIMINGNSAGRDLTTDDVARLDGFEGVSAVARVVSAGATESDIPLYAVDPDDAAATLNFDGFIPGANEVVAHPGVEDDFVVQTGSGPVTLDRVDSEEIGSFFTYVSTETAESFTEPAPAINSALWLKADPELTPAELVELRTEIADALGIEEYAVSGGAIEKGMYSQIIDALLMVVVGLLAVAVLIAIVGVTNTLSLSVLERTRENSLLRALGLRAAQLRQMLTAEAILIGATAALIGTLLGSVYGLLGVQSALSQMADTVVSIPWWQLLGVLAVAVIASWLASVVPGRRSARLSPVEGLASE